MAKSKGKRDYAVVAIVGRVQRVVEKRMTYADAVAFCDENNWNYDYNGGLIWDLDIVEDAYAFNGIR